MSSFAQKGKILEQKEETETPAGSPVAFLLTSG